MMVYFDTNIYLYAFCKNVDDIEQKKLSQKLLKKYASSGNLLVSEIILYEYAYVARKLGESAIAIQKILKFLSRYIVCMVGSVHIRVLDIFDVTEFYTSSFDIYHLAYTEHHNATLYTFDKGFKKLHNIAKVKIEIL